MNNKHFDETFKNNEIDAALRVVDYLRGTAVGRCLYKEMLDLRTKVTSLQEAETREDWDALIHSVINPQWRIVDRRLEYRFGIGLGDVLKDGGFIKIYDGRATSHADPSQTA